MLDKSYMIFYSDFELKLGNDFSVLIVSEGWMNT